MLAQHGLNATSIRETAKRAEAPVGSTYHHFPGGKQQVVSEAVALAAGRVQRQLEERLRGGAAPGLSSFLAWWRDLLLATDFRQGCPVMAAAAEEPIDGTSEEARHAAANAFGEWIRVLTTSLHDAGHSAAAAHELATLIVASIEGAIVLCRSERDIKPFDAVATQLKKLVQPPRRLPKPVRVYPVRQKPVD